MNDAELAWVAGFLEGEGWFQLMRCDKGRFGVYHYPRVACTSTDLIRSSAFSGTQVSAGSPARGSGGPTSRSGSGQPADPSRRSN